MNKPLPRITERMKPFWDAAAQGRLLVQQCTGCGACHFPARDSCPVCLGTDMDWSDATGHATLFSFTVMHHVYDPSFADEVPYAVAAVKLDEGPLIISNVVDCPPTELTIGMPLEVVFDEIDEGLFLPRFRRSAT